MFKKCKDKVSRIYHNKLKIQCKLVVHKREETKCTVRDYCCRKMDEVINFVDTDEGYRTYSSNFHVEECGIKIPVTGSYEGNDMWEFIRYCPFCGCEIEGA